MRTVVDDEHLEGFGQREDLVDHRRNVLFFVIGRNDYQFAHGGCRIFWNYKDNIILQIAAILWFACLVAAQLFFDADIFGKSFSSFIWRGLIILLIVGVSGLLLLTSVSIYENNKTLAYVSGAMILVTALFALLFFIIGKYEKGFLSTSTLTLVILSLLINQITDMQYRAKKSLTGLKIAAGVTGGVIALILELSVYSLMGKFWNSTAFVFFFVVLCLAFIGLKIAVGAIAKSANGKAEKSETEAAADNTGAAEETVTISRAEYEELLKIKAEYENKK